MEYRGGKGLFFVVSGMIQQYDLEYTFNKDDETKAQKTRKL